MTNYVKIFDTTLRDGEQSPGATMTSAEKLEVAHNLARLGVDIIESGFPAASPDDLEAVRRIALEVGNPPEGSPEAKVPVIAGLARANKPDIDKAWEAVKGAKKTAHSYLPRHVAHPHETQVEDGPGRGHSTRVGDGDVCKVTVCRCGIFTRRCRPFRP